jgi:hypothetical protein
MRYPLAIHRDLQLLTFGLGLAKEIALLMRVKRNLEYILTVGWERYAR